ncbi:MAG: hypothetical protein H0U74_01800 [Bradymonadaceae bacterium]|nr:hypothetical protein [Lujinxingiaceae bacterium]
MDLNKLRGIHPDWKIIEALAPDEAASAINLLLAGVFLNGRLTEDEPRILAQTWSRFPFVSSELNGYSFIEHLKASYDRLVAMLSDPDQFEAFLDDVSTNIPDEDARLAVLRLLALVLNEEDLHTRQQDFFGLVSLEFGFDLDTADNLLRSAWESYQDAGPRPEGESRFKPLIKGRNLSATSRFTTSSNPFSQDLY